MGRRTLSEARYRGLPLFKISVFQSVGPWWVAKESPGNLRGLHVFGLCPGSAAWETLGAGPSWSGLTRPLGDSNAQVWESALYLSPVTLFPLALPLSLISFPHTLTFSIFLKAQLESSHLCVAFSDQPGPQELLLFMTLHPWIFFLSYVHVLCLWTTLGTFCWMWHLFVVLTVPPT